MDVTQNWKHNVTSCQLGYLTNGSLTWQKRSFCKNQMSLLGISDRGTISLVIWCQFSLGQPLDWSTPKLCSGTQLSSPKVSGTSLMAKIHSDHFYAKNVDFQCLWWGYPKLGYMVSLQLSAATWLINTKTLLRTSTILNISVKNITNV